MDNHNAPDSPTPGGSGRVLDQGSGSKESGAGREGSSAGRQQETLRDKLTRWWYTRVQGDLAAFFITLAAFDLTPYADALTEAFPRVHHLKSFIRIAGGIAIFTRALQARRGNRGGNTN